MRRASGPLRVVVAGGGFATAELVLALRALAEERVGVEVVTPDTALPFRAGSTATPFGAPDVAVYDLAELLGDCGARLHQGRVEAAAPRARRVRLASGAHLDYDVLVVATGARARSAIPGAITFRDQRDAHLVRQLMERARDRIVFAAPSGVSWTLPLYELALMASASAAAREILVVSPEREPLEVFGPEVGAHVDALLRRHRVQRRPGIVVSVGRGRLVLGDGEALEADGVVAVPRLTARRLSGIPAGADGFIPTDPRGRVVGLDDVYAAGDVTRFPVKQGGLATQQADVVAAAIAERAGAEVPQTPGSFVLRTRLLGPQGPCYLRAELGADGRVPANQAAAIVSDEPDWWPPAKLFGRHLSPWMALRSAGGTSERGAHQAGHLDVLARGDHEAADAGA